MCVECLSSSSNRCKAYEYQMCSAVCLKYPTNKEILSIQPLNFKEYTPKEKLASPLKMFEKGASLKVKALCYNLHRRTNKIPSCKNPKCFQTNVVCKGNEVWETDCDSRCQQDGSSGALGKIVDALTKVKRYLITC